jgi:hypothetical protein
MFVGVDVSPREKPSRMDPPDPGPGPTSQSAAEPQTPRRQPKKAHHHEQVDHVHHGSPRFVSGCGVMPAPIDPSSVWHPGPVHQSR